MTAAMSVTLDDSFKRWTAKRKTALVMEIIQGKMTVAEVSGAKDLLPSEIEARVGRCCRRTRPHDMARPLVALEESIQARPLALSVQSRDQNEVAHMRLFQKLLLRGGDHFKRPGTGQKRADFATFDVGD